MHNLLTHTFQHAARLDSVGEYYFSVKLRQIDGLQRQGIDIISLAIGGPDMPPPDVAVKEAVGCLNRPNTHGYQPSAGSPELRRAFADWYGRFYKVYLDPDKEILPLVGSKEAIVMLSLALLNPGDKVLVPNPGYAAYSSASKIAGADVITYDLLPENSWLPDFNAIESVVSEEVKIMWINYPNMPTGTPASRELFERVVDFGRHHNILIVNDNPYSFILNPQPISILEIEGASEFCLELNSLSKCLNMPGWRVGMIAGRPDVINWVLTVKSNMDSGQPLAVMKGAVAALKESDSWYESLNTMYGKRQKIAAKIMNALGCEVSEGQQGLFLWGRIPDVWKNSGDFSDAILEKARVFITPGFIFGSNGDRYLRLSLCAPEEILEEALHRISNCKFD